ncbi:MAG: NUDIX domain-containing protein [Planctomycetota bacterium]|jgi:8-oxo-dGTP diphosphatase
MSAPRQFGERELGHAYVERPSAYLVVEDGKGRVLCVRAKGDLHLPGGGIDPGETPEEAALRELREETGHEARILRRIGEAGQYVRGFNKLGTFFLARVGNRVAEEGDHEPIWLDPEEASERLLHASHRWALERACMEA